MSASAFYNFEHNFWDITSDPYDEGFGHVTSQSIPYIIEKLNLTNGSKILDVACGPGYVSEYCADKNVNVVGVDFSNAMISLARSKHPNCIFEVASADNLPFDDNSFDGVSCNFGILHFPDPEKAMAQAYRVCKSGARYAYAVWNTLDQSPAMAVLMSAIEKYASIKPDLPEAPPFFFYAQKENAEKAMKNVGFTQVDFKVVSAVWSIKSVKSFLDYFKDGGARIGAILRAQTEENLNKIISDIEQNIQIYKLQTGYNVPVSMVIVSGEKK